MDTARKGCYVGKRKKVQGAGARRGKRGEGRTGAVAAGALPGIDTLENVPGFGDVVPDGAQTAAFEAYRAEAERADELLLGCVVRLDRGFPLVATERGTFRAEHDVAFAKRDRTAETPVGTDMLPAIGDWVAVRRDEGHDVGVIERVLPRRTVFARWRGKNRGERQVLAANIDTVLIVQPLGSVRDTPQLIRDRVARSLVLANDCGATPVVVLTKADRCEPAEVEATIADLRALAGEGLRVVATSSVRGEGLDEVRACVPAGTCAMILGESGAGKSTLLNTLLGREALATGAVRERDDMGRHTTVARVMVNLPSPCGVIADSPGLRSLPLVGHEMGLARTFPEVVRAARACRFGDCTHTHEPGCRVRELAGQGLMTTVSVDAFVDLAREMRVSAQSLDPDIHL